MTSIFVIYKVRNQQGVEILARLVEAFYDKEKAHNALVAYDSILSHSERGVGWSYHMEPVEIIDQLETSPEQ